MARGSGRARTHLAARLRVLKRLRQAGASEENIRKALSTIYYRQKQARELGDEISGNTTIRATGVALARTFTDGRCAYCGREFADEKRLRETVDHYVPLARGGSHDVSNMVLACLRCNGDKGEAMPGTKWVPRPEYLEMRSQLGHPVHVLGA